MAKLDRLKIQPTLIQEQSKSPTQEEKKVEPPAPNSNIRSLKELLEEYKRKQSTAIETKEPTPKPKESTIQMKEPIAKEPTIKLYDNTDYYSRLPVRKRYRDWIDNAEPVREPVEKKVKTDDSWSMAKTVDTIGAYGVQIVGALVLYFISCAARTYKPSGSPSSVATNNPPLPTQSYGDFYRNPYG
jgi:hypothetical protein